MRENDKFITAIDIALENNQIRALKLILDYVIQYQNSYVFSFLFRCNLINIIEKGIKVANLMQSNIFNVEF